MRKENQLLKNSDKNNLSSPNVSVGDLPHLMPLLLLNRKQQPYSIREAEDPGLQIAGMTSLFNNNKAFTLIELLVVVLIIGILAAVAVPQYQKAVEKSRATQAMTLVKSVYQAADAYYMANGVWPTSFDELSVDIPWKGTISATGRGTDARSNNDWSLEIYGNALYKAVLATRLSGKYKGGRFAMWKKHEVATVPKDTLLCGEQKTGTYKLANGVSFCTKLFQGTTKLAEGDSGRVYTFLQ